MNLFELSPTWLTLLFCAVLIAAAVEDVVRLRISNLTVLAAVACAGVAIAVAGPRFGLWENLVVCGVLLLGGTLLFAAGKVGGGDVKLFAAVGLWADLERAVPLVATVFIAGGCIALFVIVPRMVLGRAGGRSLRERSRQIPYGVAIATGALLVIGYQHEVSRIERPNPLEFHPLPAVAPPQD